MRQSVRALVAVAFAATLLSACVNASAASITPTVSPTRGSISAEYAFVVRYSGQLAVSSATVYINGEARAMGEVDPADQNVTNGKDYSLVTKLPEGANVYYFLVVDANGTEYRSAAGTVVVDPLLEFGHFDVALAVLLFMLPLAYAMLLMRRATKALEKVAKRLEPKDEKPEAGIKEPEAPLNRG
ncbi:MAG: hypothetical protein V1934_06420 [Methanobacteriota archaeon]